MEDGTEPELERLVTGAARNVTRDWFHLNWYSPFPQFLVPVLDVTVPTLCIFGSFLF